MRYRRADVGITAAAAILTCAAAAVGAPVAVTAALGAVLFVAPGYLLAELLLGSGIAGLERVAAILGLAFSVPILGGLALYAAGLQLNRGAWLGLQAGVTLACDVAVLVGRVVRSRSVSAPPPNRPATKRHVPARHVAAFGAALVIAGGAVGVAHLGASRQHYAGFTQLWLTHATRDARTVDLGVGNYEGRTTRYRLVLLYGGKKAVTWNLTLANGQTWQRSPRFGPDPIVADLFRLPDLVHIYRNVNIDARRTPGT